MLSIGKSMNQNFTVNFIREVKNRHLLVSNQTTELIIRQVRNKIAANTRKPLTLLLIGGTGTGKTELYKALAASLRVKEQRIEERNSVVTIEATPILKYFRRCHDSQCVIEFHYSDRWRHSQHFWSKLREFLATGEIGSRMGAAICPQNTIVCITTCVASHKFSVSESEHHTNAIWSSCSEFPDFLHEVVDQVVTLTKWSEDELIQLATFTMQKVAARYGMYLLIESKYLLALLVKSEVNESGARGIMSVCEYILSEANIVELMEKGIRVVKLVPQWNLSQDYKYKLVPV